VEGVLWCSLWHMPLAGDDSSEHNATFKSCFTDAEEKLLTMKNDRGLAWKIGSTDIIPLVNIAFTLVFTHIESNRHAISDRG
jgi:glutamate formiminotransferase